MQFAIEGFRRKLLTWCCVTATSLFSQSVCAGELLIKRSGASQNLATCTLTIQERDASQFCTQELVLQRDFSTIAIPNGGSELSLLKFEELNATQTGELLSFIESFCGFDVPESLWFCDFFENANTVSFLGMLFQEPRASLVRDAARLQASLAINESKSSLMFWEFSGFPRSSSKIKLVRVLKIGKIE